MTLMRMIAPFLLASLAPVMAQEPQPTQPRPRTRRTMKPLVMGKQFAVSSMEPGATMAAQRILQAGGNAFDAGTASLLAGGVLEQDLYSLGGEALVLVYPKKKNKVTSVVGQGWAPSAVNVE